MSTQAKTTATNQDPLTYIRSMPDNKLKQDGLQLLDIFKSVTGFAPVMWGSSIIGFGTYANIYPNGKTTEWPITGFAIRKDTLTVYIMPGFGDFEPLLQNLGKYKTGKSCLYIKKIDDIDVNALTKLIRGGVEYMQSHYQTKP